MEIVELDQSLHPFYVAAQFHPEFKSRVMCPSPLFLGLLQVPQKSPVHCKRALLKSPADALVLQASTGQQPKAMSEGPQSPRKRSAGGAR